MDNIEDKEMYSNKKKISSARGWGRKTLGITHLKLKLHNRYLSSKPMYAVDGIFPIRSNLVTFSKATP